MSSSSSSSSPSPTITRASSSSSSSSLASSCVPEDQDAGSEAVTTTTTTQQQRPQPRNNPANKTRRISVSLCRFCLLEVPLLLCFVLVLSTLFIQELWHGPLQQLLESFELQPTDDTNDLTGLYTARDPDMTYYHRRCEQRDISTHSANDLLIKNNFTAHQSKQVMMTHGAVILKDILSHTTATKLRQYLEERHTVFQQEHGKEHFPYNELMWDGEDGSRLALGLGPDDHPSIAQALDEVGTHPQLRHTLEAILGPNPALVEVATLSTMHGASAQPIHTDTDYFGSSVLYARTFFHSYTMFIALQDTTSRMGATTLCPGTHFCADDELEQLCTCDAPYDDEDEDDDSDDDDEEEDDDDERVCNTFEVSSNGKTGIDVGVLHQGDALLFNQNVWHRGPQNNDPHHKINRVNLIFTFVSRRSFDQRVTGGNMHTQDDQRQQGWGTYYYMRYNLWGHTLEDLSTSLQKGRHFFLARVWKAFGLSSNGSISWLEHFARQLANRMDFFAASEFEDFYQYIQQLKRTNPLLNWLVLEDETLEALFTTHGTVMVEEDTETDEVGIDEDQDDNKIHDEEDTEHAAEKEDSETDNAMSDAMDTTDSMPNPPPPTRILFEDWEEYLELLIASIVYQSKKLYAIMTILTMVGISVLTRSTTRRPVEPCSSSSPSSNFCTTSIRTSFVRLVLGHVLIGAIGGGILRRYVLYDAPLFKRIQTQQIHVTPFPDLPFVEVVTTATEVTTTTTIDATNATHARPNKEDERVVLWKQLHPMDLLWQQQTQLQDAYKQTTNSKHPFDEYYTKELQRRLPRSYYHPGSIYIDNDADNEEEDNARWPPQPPRHALTRLYTQKYYQARSLPPYEFRYDAYQLPTITTAFPERYDVLIGSRYDTPFLASMDDMLRYHPGNVIWYDLIHQYAAAGIRRSSSMIDIIANDIVHGLISSDHYNRHEHEESAASGGFQISASRTRINYGGTGQRAYQAGVPRRFLHQEYRTGYWLVMSYEEAVERTRRELLAVWSPHTIGVLYTYWHQILARSRFGALRSTVLATKYIPRIVDDWMTTVLFPKTPTNYRGGTAVDRCDRLDGIHSPIEDISCGVGQNNRIQQRSTPRAILTPMRTPQLIGGTHTANSLSSTLLPSTGRNIMPKSMVFGTVGNNIPIIVGRRTSDPISYRQYLQQHNADVVTLQIGDMITVKGTGHHDTVNGEDGDDSNDHSRNPQSQQQLPFQAMILDITDDELLDLRPIRTDLIIDDGDDTHEEDDEQSHHRRRSGRILRNVHIGDIQLYRPSKEGDHVWVLSDDVHDDDGNLEDAVNKGRNDNDDDGTTLRLRRPQSWKVYEVLYLTPFGTAEVVLLDDESFDPHDEPNYDPVTMDVRDFFLIDTEVPYIRLQQQDY